MSEALGTPVAPRAVRALACPSCGAAVALRAMAWTQTVACANCGAVLDAADPNLRVLQQADRRRTGPEPLVPLGARGRWRGAEYEAVGFQERFLMAGGAQYAWREYVLFNPYHGFRYLVEYDGHWTDVVPLAAPPVPAKAGGRPAVRLGDVTYRHFQTASARTRYVLGEFPWELRSGDRAEVRDFVAPPFVLSAEQDEGEVAWSRGEYVDGREVWRAFALPGRPPHARGVYANQPSPHAGARGLAPLFLLFAALLLAAALGRLALARRAVAFQQQYAYAPPATADAADSTAPFVTPSFALGPGRFGLPANVQIETDAAVDNQWMAVDYALVDEGTGVVYESSRDVSYYSGTDSDGRWTEGSPRDAVRIGPVPPGRYFLRVAPSGGDPARGGAPVAWTLTVRRDVPSVGPFLLALLALAVPPGVAALRAAAFEQRRWAESDYAPSTSSDDE